MALTKRINSGINSARILHNFPALLHAGSQGGHRLGGGGPVCAGGGANGSPSRRCTAAPLQPPLSTRCCRCLSSVVTMVLKTTNCRFSGLRIYPGRGILYIRVDGQQYLFLNKKCKSLYNNRLRPAKLAWTYTYRKQHKKDQTETAGRKKRRTVNKQAARSIAGTSLEVIQKKRMEKPEVRQASREAALREIKDRQKKMKVEKKKAASSAPKGGKGAAVKNRK
jgi:large subunit ribosomal protein L24e